MSRLRLLVAEALHSIRSNVSTTVAAMMTVFIGMFLLGVCIALGSWMVSWSNHIKNEIVVHAYFCAAETCDKPATDGDKSATLSRILQIKQQGLVKNYRYVSKEEGLVEMKKTDYKLVEGLGGVNPLPDAYYITPSHGENASKIAAELRSPPLQGVEKIDLQREGDQAHSQRGLGDRDLVRGDGDHPADRVHGADRQHDSPLDLLTPARDRGDEAGRGDQLVRARTVHDRGPDLRLRRRAACGDTPRHRQGRGHAGASSRRERR